MIKSLLLFSSLLFAAAISLSVEVDTEASQVSWKGYKVTGGHEGTIAVQDGNLDFTDGVLTGGSFTIDMASLKATDVSGEAAAKLEGHLKSDDFFGGGRSKIRRSEIWFYFVRIPYLLST